MSVASTRRRRALVVERFGVDPVRIPTAQSAGQRAATRLARALDDGASSP
ncbi:MAG: hypothetical protein ABEJ82_03470 [Haloplanus sp.]